MHVHAYVCMHEWAYDHLAACSCMCMRAYMHVCTFCNTPDPQVLKLTSLALAPNIEKLPTPKDKLEIGSFRNR